MLVSNKSGGGWPTSARDETCCHRLPQTADAATTYLSGLTYNGAGQATAFQYGNGVQAAFSYNDHLELATLRYSKSGAPDLLNLAYDYTSGVPGNNGQIQKIHYYTAPGTEDLTRSENFSYDAWGRLSTAGTGNATSWGLSWNYDRFGNRLNQNVTAGSAPGPSVSVDANTNRINSAGYAYDAAGNMIWDAIHDYAYDAENRLTAVDPQLNPVAATYTYLDALRVKKVAGGTTTVYVYSGTKPIAEYATDNTGTKLTEHIYGGSGMLATINPDGSTTYEHPDHLSIRVESDSNGNVLRTYGHFPFGETWYENLATGVSAGKWDFTTYERDSESGLDYANFRNYSSRLGRFMEADPLAGHPELPGSLDRYSYVVNDPVNLVDPLGLDLGLMCHFEPQKDGSYKIAYCWWVNLGGGGGGWGQWGARIWQRLRKLVPKVCSGGGFVYGGVEFNLKSLKLESLGIVAYDSKSGGEHGGILAGGFGSFTAGVESLRTWRDWKEHTTLIGLGNASMPVTPTNVGPLKVDSADFGGIVQYQNGEFTIGGYAGGSNSKTARAAGGGGYVSLSWTACHN